MKRFLSKLKSFFDWFKNIRNKKDKRPSINIPEKIPIEEKITIEESGKKKPILEKIEGDEFDKKDNKYVSKERTIDREKDKYKEVIKDEETGKVLHSCQEPLSKHTGHGSDKNGDK